MKLKNKWKQFWTLERRANHGFTLVELIVVIAILGILGGGATVGYSGYVKNAAKKTDMTLVGDVVRALDTANNSHAFSFEVEGQYSDGLQIPVGFVVISNEAYDDNTYTKVISSASEGAVNPIDGALSTAFGSEYTKSMKLESEKWEDVTYSSFFTQGSAMLERVQTTGQDTLDFVHKFKDKGNFDFTETGDIEYDGWLVDYSVNVLSRDYETTDELVAALADEVSGVDRTTFINEWKTLTQEQNPSGFYLGGREFYSAVRGAYSQSFANCVSSANDHTRASAHASAIANHGQPGGDLIAGKLADKGLGAAGSLVGAIIGANDMTFPLAIGEDTFTGHGSTTLSENAENFYDCQECYNLWKNSYYNSAQAEADAAGFYDMMVTATTHESETEGKPEDGLLSWAGKQTDLFEDMYGALDDYTKDRSAVAMAVYYNSTTGLLDIDVLPEAADPRAAD